MWHAAYTSATTYRLPGVRVCSSAHQDLRLLLQPRTARRTQDGQPSGILGTRGREREGLATIDLPLNNRVWQCVTLQTTYVAIHKLHSVAPFMLYRSIHTYIHTYVYTAIVAMYIRTYSYGYTHTYVRT